MKCDNESGSTYGLTIGSIGYSSDTQNIFFRVSGNTTDTFVKYMKDGLDPDNSLKPYIITAYLSHLPVHFYYVKSQYRVQKFEIVNN